MDNVPAPVHYFERYLDALLAGEMTTASDVITDALQHGVGVASLYLEVITPAQVEIGERWHRRELDVAQEHLATQISLAQLQRLRAAVHPGSRGGPRAVVASVENEQHDLGARVVAEFLLMDGWEVDFLGASTPTDDLGRFVARRRPALAVLSVTLPDHLAHAAKAVNVLRKLPEPPAILLGGNAVRENPAEAGKVGADAISLDAWDAVRRARELVTRTSESPSLDQVLRELGERIRERRRARRWSQQQLGDAAGLDRTYVNAVEQGKQNLTLSAVLRLAGALEVPVDRLLFST
jgi:methanogenic corrinoid protein MtbC1/DNA-binding XRE family transcriptional regulator